MLITPVIMCGGGGTRLWPSSRTNYPKPFVPLIGDASTFDRTLARVADRAIFTAPVIIANEDHRFLVADACMKARLTDARLVLEPEARDTAAAIAAAAEIVVRRDPKAIMLVLAADHVVADIAAFAATCTRALPAAQAGRIITFGIAPTEPATGYGYISPAAAADAEGVHKVAQFREKPDAAQASAYIELGYLWNSGNFLMSAATLLADMARLEPELASHVRASVDAASDFWGATKLDAAAFGQARKVSIDYAVMEKSGLVDVIKADYAWSDVGTWDAVWALTAKDASGNALIGEVENCDSHDTYVHSPGMLTALVGVRNLAVVVTADAVLIADRSRTQDVKKLVDTLKISRPAAVAAPKRGYRPWGYYETLDLGPRYQVKRIVVKQGGKLSLQKHFHRAETWTVVAGSALVEVDSVKKLLGENESIYLPLGCIHRLENPGKMPLVLIEVQCGPYLGEDDIVRLEDVYARV